MFFRKSEGTFVRWVWSELESSVPSGYLLGALSTALVASSNSAAVTVYAPPPSALPLTLYIEQEQMSLSAIAGGTYTITRAQNAVDHPAHALAFTDSFEPVARDYSLRNPPAPLHFGSHALCYCEMTADQLQAAQQDPRLIVLPSMYDPAPIPEAIAAALEQYGVTAGMSQIEMLKKLGEVEPQFIPEV